MGISPSHTITASNLTKIEQREERIKKILEIAKENIKNTLIILKWNKENNIFVYRMSSKIIPLATWDGIEIDYQEELKKEFEKLGKFIRENRIRISFHPDHYSVMNTPSDKIFEATKKDLQYHTSMLEAMGLGESYKMVVHVGGTYGDKEYGKKNFIHRFQTLSPSVQKRIILENDDKSYHCKDVLDLCGKLNIPMVMDIHHFQVNNMGEDLEETLKLAFHTWDHELDIPKVHFSSPRNEKEIRAHAEYINTEEFMNFLKIANKIQRDFDVMLEAKGKDLSILKLRNELCKKH